MKYVLHTSLVWLAVVLNLLTRDHRAVAASIQYIYDDGGRLAAVVDPSSETARYSYDLVGNVTNISRYASSDLSVINFVPPCGPPGTTVTIAGTGFPGTPTVTFNGSPASVTAATSAQIVTAVPASAATGPISVAGSGGFAQSLNDFRVGCKRPTIASISPGSGAPGTAITINGSDFGPTVLSNRVEFNGQLAVVDSASYTSIVAEVPPAAVSGKITVVTAFGSVLSASNFTVTTP